MSDYQNLVGAEVTKLELKGKETPHVVSYSFERASNKRGYAAPDGVLWGALMKLQIGRAYSAKFMMLLLAIVACGLFEYVMHRQSGIFREYEAACLSLQWMLLACLAVWCGKFLFLTFGLKDLPIIGLLLIAITFYFIGYTVHSCRDALTLLAGVTLGKGAKFLLSKDKRWQMGNGKNNLEIVNRQSPIVNFFVGLIGLLAFSSWWHLDMANNFYRGPRRMGLWNNPNTYGMLMGAGGLLAIGLLTANAKLSIKNAKICSSRGKEAHLNLQPDADNHEPSVRASSRRLLQGFLLVAAGMMGVGLIMSYSRGAWLATTVGLTYLAWCYGKLKWRYVLPVVVVAAAVVLCHWGSTPDSAPWYVKRADLGRPSAQHRATAWRAGLEIMRDHPLGVGWNNAVSVYAKDYSPPEDGAAAITTNDYMMLGTELGIPALLCFVAYVGLCYWKSPRIQQLESRSQDEANAPSSLPSPPMGAKESEALRAACLSGALVFVVAFWFDGGLFKLPTAAVFWVLLELGAAHTQRQRAGMKNEAAAVKI